MRITKIPTSYLFIQKCCGAVAHNSMYIFLIGIVFSFCKIDVGKIQRIQMPLPHEIQLCGTLQLRYLASFFNTSRCGMHDIIISHGETYRRREHVLYTRSELQELFQSFSTIYFSNVLILKVILITVITCQVYFKFYLVENYIHPKV